MTLEEMRRKKIEYGLTSEMIAQASGVPLGTVQKIFGGITKAPRKRTIDAIAQVFLEEEQRQTRGNNPQYRGAEQKNPYEALAQPAPPLVRETAGNYSTARKPDYHTLEDYYALPEESRVELIDGVFYDQAAPSRMHQLVLEALFVQFWKCAEEHDLPCEVYLSPCDVRLDHDDYTMVQPDLFVVCGYEDPDARRIEGAPDLIAEILSPATRMKDMVLKLYKYQRAGVKEYWIVDPKKRTVTIHIFEDEYLPKTYSFQEDIPVGLSEGRCFINLSGAVKKLERHGW